MMEYSREPEGLPRIALFELGQVVGTPGAIEAIAAHHANVNELVMRHVMGFWGDIDPEDRAANECALIHGGRIFSAYFIGEQSKIWIITEADRSYTTLLLPSEY